MCRDGVRDGFWGLWNTLQGEVAQPWGPGRGLHPQSRWVLVRRDGGEEHKGEALKVWESGGCWGGRLTVWVEGLAVWRAGWLAG